MSFWAQAGSTEQRRAAAMKRYKWISIVSPRLRRESFLHNAPPAVSWKVEGLEEGANSVCAMDCPCRGGGDRVAAAVAPPKADSHGSLLTRSRVDHRGGTRGSRRY